MKSIKYDKEEFQDLVNSVTPLQAVEWLLMNGYPIQVRNLGKSTVDMIVMLCGKMFVSKENRGLYTTIQMGKKLCRLYILKTGSWY